LKQFEKSLTELQRIGHKIQRLFNPERPFEVDIELMLEREGICIDAVPLKAEKGIEAWISLSARILYVDISLADTDWQERRYRFTLAEEYAHKILHQGIFAGATTPEEWIARWNKIPEELYLRLDRQAKELAGILLMPESEFTARMLELRDDFINIGGPRRELALTEKARIVMNVLKSLVDDFNVNEEPCRIRFQRLTYGKDFFSM